MIAHTLGKRPPNFVCQDCGHMFHVSLDPIKLRLRKLLRQKGPFKCPKCGSTDIGSLCC